jgi:hypothetical protein
MRAKSIFPFRLLVVAPVAFFFSVSVLRADPTPFAIPPVDLIYPVISPVISGRMLDEYDPPGSELTEKGRNIRGIYIPVNRLKSRKVNQLVRWIVDKVGANAVLIDIKDDRGRVTFTHELKSASGPAHGALSRRISKLVAELKQRDVYLIGRLVCFKDNQFMRSERGAMVRDKRTDKIWRDHANMAWIDPYSSVAREYIASIAKAAQELGFDEIQLDYVRFPVEPASRYAKFANREGEKERREAIATLLDRVDREITIPLSIDVFGLTAYNMGDPDGLGQSLEHLAPHLDAISPMLYLANWPKRAWEDPKPSRNFALVHNAIRHIRNRIGDRIAVRPLLQAFEYRARDFGVPFIQNQVSAAESAGSSGYLFWNQSGSYWEVSVVWRGSGTTDVLAPEPNK